MSDALKYKISVMQAALEGKPIQVQAGGFGEWIDTKNPHWIWNSNNYRVKPEEVSFVIVRDNKTNGIYSFREDTWEAAPRLSCAYTEIKRVKVTL